MLRRLSLVLVTSGALLVSAGIGVLAADWPFLHRLWQLPADVSGWRETVAVPTVTIAGSDAPYIPPAAPDPLGIDAALLEQAASQAEAEDSVALLVLHRGALLIERYWHGITRDTLYPLEGLTRALLGIAYGRALDDGSIESLDAPIEQWLPEWYGEPRGAITIRQLLWNVSGLETPAEEGWWGRLGKAGRLRFGTTFERTALSYRAAHEPGTRFELSRVDAQLAALVLERASDEDYAGFIERSVWQPARAGRAEFTLDRPHGAAAAFDGLRATPIDVLKIGALLALDSGWAGEMARGSLPNPRYGLQASAVDGDGLLLSGDGRAVWVWPGEQLVIVRLGDAAPGWDASAWAQALRRSLH
ncbi:MAG TPA: serine hydrolase domain-containing protein [Steroidobacteraceae bacterium]|nr:serine hydrolase domain-containing protein [Steroidobacteraceae bacterium]HNS27019.1 serine hydrolase domain-containing protein [Steroidobacteraceae bacterium]